MIKALIFDLDGVLVSTDEFHYRAWDRLASEENFPFSRELNKQFLGVSRKACLQIFLEKSGRAYSDEEQEEMLQRKNSYYREMLVSLGAGDVFSGIPAILLWLKEIGISLAIGSSSRNAPLILEKTGLAGYFDTVVDGNHIERSKPDPQVFLMGARNLALPPDECLVIEDAPAGVDAALAAGMKVIGVGSAAAYEKAHYRAEQLTLEFLRRIIAEPVEDIK